MKAAGQSPDKQHINEQWTIRPARWRMPSTNKTVHIDIAEILLKMALNTINQTLLRAYLDQTYLLVMLDLNLPWFQRKKWLIDEKLTDTFYLEYMQLIGLTISQWVLLMEQEHLV